MLTDKWSTTPSPATPLMRFSRMPIISPPSDLSSGDRGLVLIKDLVNCANCVDAGDFQNANALIRRILLLATPHGDSMQRVASYLSTALAACIINRSFPSLYTALTATSAVGSPSDALLVRRHFFDLCPFLRLAAVVANNAILEAMEGEKVVHVIDLHAWDPAQWVDLLMSFSSRAEGAPHLRITGVHEQKEVLDRMGALLVDAAERLDVPFQFNQVVCSNMEDLDREALRVKTGEALAISSILQLHTLLASDDEAGTSARSRTSTPHERTFGELLQREQQQLLIANSNGFATPSPDVMSVASTPSPVVMAPCERMESFLTMLHGLSPKIMVVAEQESDHNSPALGERFNEALYYYAAVFDGLDSTVPRLSPERGRLERSLFGEEIRNIIACDGAQRTERHERLGRWAARLGSAGFGKVAISYAGMRAAAGILEMMRCDGYTLREENRCLMLGWKGHSLFSVSAWRWRARFDPSSY